VTEPPVLQQIIQEAKNDPTFLGVMGFPFSNSAAIAYPVLEKEHIAIISPSASSNQLTGKSSYFFRVAPPDDEQTRYGAQYATQVLHAQVAAVLLDPKDPYSESLGDSFASNFLSDGPNNHVSKHTYTKGQTDTLNEPLHNVLLQSPVPDMIFFAGYADDLNALKDMVSSLAPNMIIMGGDASYELGGYDNGNYAHFYFTAFTYPDTWDILCPKGPACTNVRPAFVDDYAATFDPNHQHPGEYSYARTGPHSILAYDATVAFLQAGDSVIHSGDGSISTDGVRNALAKVKFQGASGQVSFSGSNPVNKSIVMLCVDSHHLTHLVAVFGQFIDGASAQQKIYSTDVCR
jgi:ABC-type branched-subunit amino acid transport system substrate-binding protein